MFSTLFGMLYCTVTDVYAYASLAVSCFPLSHAVRHLLCLFVTLSGPGSLPRTQLEEELKYADRSLQAQKKQFDGLATHMDEMRRGPS